MEKEKKVIQISLKHLILIVLVIAIIIGGILFANMQEKTTVNNKPDVSEKVESEKHGVELAKTYVAEGLQLSLKYHNDWKIEEESSSYLKFMNQNDEKAFIGVFIEKDFDNTREIKDYLYAYNDMSFSVEEEGKIIIAGLEGYYHKVYVGYDGNKVFEAGIVKDGNLYKFMYYTNKTDYAKYEDIFTSMLSSVEFVQK